VPSDVLTRSQSSGYTTVPAYLLARLAVPDLATHESVPSEPVAVEVNR
jgi:hypothetical protein